MHITCPRPSIVAAVLALGACPAVAGAATSSGGVPQTQTADVAATLEAAFPANLSWGALTVGTAGTESAEQVINVKSNKPWGVRLSTDEATGRMRLYNGSYGSALTHPLQWRLASVAGVAQATSFGDLSSTAANAATARPITTDLGVNVGLRFKQVMSYADAPAGTGETYRVVVTYDAAQGY